MCQSLRISGEGEVVEVDLTPVLAALAQVVDLLKLVLQSVLVM
jgi:hypothetical protein